MNSNHMKYMTTPKSGYSIYYQFLFHSDDTECKTESTMGRSTTEDSIPHPPTKQKNRKKERIIIIITKTTTIRN